MAEEHQSLLLLSEDLSKQYLNKALSDVTFIPNDGEALPAHRFLLVTRSEFFGKELERNQKEIRVHASAESFRLVLRYLYCGFLSLDTIGKETLLETLHVAHRYRIESLVTLIANHLEKNLSIEIVVNTFNLFQSFGLQSLSESCAKYMDCNADEILAHESLLNLSHNLLYFLLRRDSFFAPEIAIFRFVQKWLVRHPEERLNGEDITSVIRLPLLTREQLFDEVQPSQLFGPDKILEAQLKQRFPEKLAKRYAEYGLEKKDINVASAEYESKVLTGIIPSNLFSRNTLQYTHHEKGDKNGIVVELNNFYRLNHIRMQLCSDNSEEYSYFVDISLDGTNWDRVVDYSAYRCRSWQSLYFETRLVRYIRLVGTNRGLKVNSFEAKFVENVPKMLNQIVEPTENVATLEMGATVIEGEKAPNSRSTDVLLNGDFNHDANSGFVWHKISKDRNEDGISCDSIVIQLGQPYMIGSMMLHLFAKDNRTYKFYVETSKNRKDWEMAMYCLSYPADADVCDWFDSRITVFIRITGIECSKKSVRRKTLL